MVWKGTTSQSFHGDSEIKNVMCLSVTWKNKIAASHSLWQEMKTKGSLCHDGEINVCYHSRLETID